MQLTIMYREKGSDSRSLGKSLGIFTKGKLTINGNVVNLDDNFTSNIKVGDTVVFKNVEYIVEKISETVPTVTRMILTDKVVD